MRHEDSRLARLRSPRSVSVALNTWLKHKDVMRAWRDLRDGAALWRLWMTLGGNDIVRRYRRSLLGPFWLTISMAVMVIALGLLYSQILNVAIDKYIPYLCVGLLIWGFISTLLTEFGRNILELGIFYQADPPALYGSRLALRMEQADHIRP